MSLSNDTIHDRIVVTSKDILKQIVADMKASPVKTYLQVDELTDD